MDLPVKKSRGEHLDGGSEYDQELGKQMGRDARRVADGEMSQAEFYEKYHERVLEEFGEDRRDPGTGGEVDE
ncbi:4Fe-4S ferredoxin N-terminal domain-containing protein [Halapricum desulfuricans]|uniref:4Fe-4S ferredoxin iron-sulfur binding domain-containing protein n=1 Tax=Halapricum desulfuricans TaxID=2841257 RepID=A0A897MVY9_9EURY|nr:4Fe-4S ferredoxin N-terminal domain-containing protein [Halapricum desulfuricans]QSG04752.1 Uncharacterized protein HSR121_0396 [Halapricum desulfuricans]